MKIKMPELFFRFVGKNSDGGGLFSPLSYNRTLAIYVSMVTLLASDLKMMNFFLEDLEMIKKLLEKKKSS